MSQENNKPIHKIRISSVSASIFRNTSSEGKVYFNAVVERSYKDGDDWKRTSSYGMTDTLALGKVADLASTWMFENANKENASQPDQPSPE